MADAARDALTAALRYLRCPVCGLSLASSAGSIRCDTGHSFDVARQGYVSFLTGHAGASTADSAEMVAARARFLARGFFDPLAAAITDAITATIESDATGLALEIGGGTGFYLSRLLEARPSLAGIDLDLSARALRVAARAHPRLAAIAADAWQPLPLKDAAARVILSVFSPRNAAEMVRVIDPDGLLVIASPTPRHLGELVSSLGLVTVDEHKPERLERQFAAFEPLSMTTVEYPIALGADDVRDVVMMGPSARHLERGRLDDLPTETAATVSVEVRLYKPLPMTPGRERMEG